MVVSFFMNSMLEWYIQYVVLIQLQKIRIGCYISLM